MSDTLTAPTGRPGKSDERLEYVELHLLWSDRGPVARLRLRNRTPAPLAQQIVVSSHHRGAQRQLGATRVRVPPAATVDVLIDLTPDFPSPGAWLHLDADHHPPAIWAGPADGAPRIAADTP